MVDKRADRPSDFSNSPSTVYPPDNQELLWIHPGYAFFICILKTVGPNSKPATNDDHVSTFIGADHVTE